MKDTERAQATQRLMVASTALMYAVLLYVMERLPSELVGILFPFAILFLTAAATLLWHVRRRPGVYPLRRLYAMFQDYSSIGFAMIMGGEYMLPIYGLLLWVTVGYGMRYGPRYLALATSLALATLAVTAYLTPYWRAHPYMTFTLALTAVIVPIYASVLLQRSQKAHQAAETVTLAKSRFLAQASHDLRQPIHSISLFTACLRDMELTKEAQDMVDNIDKSLSSVTHLFRSILDSYTLSSGKVVPRPRKVSVQDLLEGIVQRNLESARWAGVTLRMRTAHHHVIADRELLSTVVQNFISNAIKYGPNRPVLIAARRRRGKLAIEVYDQGRGIESKHLPHLFEEFYRVRQVRDKDVEGVGLGLPIAKRISELMGLAISITSRIGRGTVAAIEGLTLTDPPQMAEVPQSDPAVAGPLHGLRILLIEDNEGALLATAALLKKWCCEVQTATGVPTGKIDCDLVVSDYDLGTDFSGADCIAQIRESAGCMIPAVLITGHDQDAVRQEIGDIDIPVLAKPIKPAELRSMLASLKLTAFAQRERSG